MAGGAVVPPSLPPLPPLPPEVQQSGSGLDIALGNLEAGTGIGRLGFWLFAGACWLAALLPCLGPVNRLHTVGSGPTSTPETSSYLEKLLTVLSRILPEGTLPVFPVTVGADPVGLTLLLVLASVPFVLLAAVWTRIPAVPVTLVRWLGLVPVIVLVVGSAVVHWNSASVELSGSITLGQSIILQAWMAENGGLSRGERILGSGDILLLRQPLGYAWMAVLGIAAGIGACLAVARPLGVSFGRLCPVAHARMSGASVMPALVVIILAGAGGVAWTRLSDGRAALATRIATQEARWKQEQAAAAADAAAEQERAAAERQRAERVEQERIAVELEQLKRRNAEDEQRRARDAITAAERTAAKAKSDAEEQERSRIEAVERERAAAIAATAAAEATRVAAAERQRQDARARQQRLEAWTVPRDALMAQPRMTLADHDQSLVALDRLAEIARSADATPDFTAIRQRIATERASLVTLQEQRVTTIRAIMRETEYRRIPDARQALAQYLAAGGDRGPIVVQAKRLDSPCPWAQDMGEDVGGVWADLDAGKVTVRLRRLPTPAGQPERWLGEREFAAADVLPLVPGRGTAVGSTLGVPATGVSFVDAKAACDALATLTTLRIRLPTVAEWTLAQSGGERIAVPPDAQLRDQVWFADSAGGTIHESGTRPANTWGFVDLLGNAAEWVVPPQGAPVLLGGSWKSQAWDLGDPQTPDASLLTTAGFRIFMEP